MRKECKEHIKYFLKNKYFIGLLLLSTLAGYGYVLTHGTNGIDDISIDLYFEKGIGVAIGRWPYYLVNKIIPIAEYVPFWGDFITILLLLISAVAWCVLLRMLVQKDVSIWAYIIFAIWFMDYSMNADVFVFYLQNGLGWLHLFIVLSLMTFLYLYRNQIIVKKQIILRIGMIACLTLAISFYESAANVFLTGMLLILFIDLWIQREESVFRGKKFLLALIFAGRYLIYAMLGRRIIRAVIMRVFGVSAYTFYRSPASIEWLVKGGVSQIGENISQLCARLYCDYFAMAVTYYPILIFVICSVIFLATMICSTWKRKDVLLFLAGVGAYISLFVLSVISGKAMEYRACQAFTIFVAVVSFGIVAIFMKGKKVLQVGVTVIMSAAILFSIYDMNQWFVLDYEKTKYEMMVIDEIAGDLKSGKYNIEEKPIVIVGDFELPDEIYNKYCVTDEETGWKIIENAVVNADKSTNRVDAGRFCYGQNFSSMIDWSIHAFAMHFGYNVPIQQFFEYRGHDEFIWASPEVTERVFKMYYPLDWEYYSYTYIELYEENYNGAAQYPKDGYIEELEDCIVIRL